MRTSIDKIGSCEERDVNVRFMAMASHYLYEPEFCNPAGQIASRLVHSDMVILDERSYLPFSALGGQLLFHLR